MNARYVVMVLLIAGTVLSGCVDEKPESLVPDTPPESGEAPVAEADIASSELAELEFEDMERELAELEAMLNEIDGESDLLADVDESLFT
jgi:hypothetical protein|uniref:Uncharacterized protein n=1 Tax=Candidatus Methanogaster sp. ANME-2c ERB4 TaxID=2759911 RepID=A0A7G9YHD3_9EURY|nr:hypothetical protein MPGFIOMI_00015 [Methanosarcinales archaeon ANME-2c ERB4]